MINYIWAALLLIGVGVGIATGRLQQVADAAMQNARDAVALSLTLLAAYVLWLGVLNIAERAGLIQKMSKGIRRVLRPLFKELPQDSEAWSFISINIAANMLGMGNAATPAGLRAMQEMQKINTDKSNASKAMCMFLIINASSVQLVPTTVITMRAAANSADPAGIVGIAFISTAFSTVIAILLAKIMERRNA